MSVRAILSLCTLTNACMLCNFRALVPDFIAQNNLHVGFQHSVSLVSIRNFVELISALKLDIGIYVGAYFLNYT